MRLFKTLSFDLEFPDWTFADDPVKYLSRDFYFVYHLVGTSVRIDDRCESFESAKKVLVFLQKTFKDKQYFILQCQTHLQVFAYE